MAARRFKYIPDEVARQFLNFAESRPEIVPRHAVLQKLAIFELVAPLIVARPHDSILEVGAGLGIHSALLSRYSSVSATELVSPGSFIGADKDVAASRDTILHCLASGSVKVRPNDGRHLSYPDASFDIVFHNSVIEHVPDVVAFNREVHRVLKPGGFCICITGTPVLCRFRLIRDWLLKLPFLAAVALVRETPLLREVAISLLHIIGVSDGTLKKIRERLLRVDDRARGLAAEFVLPRPEGTRVPCVPRVLPALYPRLYHVLYFPDYNRLVLEEIAAEAGVSPRELLSCAADHFEVLVNRLRFAFMPQTHGQHYRNVSHEMQEWRIERWRQQFESSGLTVEEVRGSRYHHLLEWSPVASWNAAFYARAASCIRAVADRHTANPTFASEIIIVARREG